MEAAGATMLFERSEANRNLVYKSLIGDKDTSTYKKVTESKPYGNLKITKINCVNHYCKRVVHLYNQLNNFEIPKLDPGDKKVTLKGKYGLNSKFIHTIKTFLGNAIRRNA